MKNLSKIFLSIFIFSFSCSAATSNIKLCAFEGVVETKPKTGKDIISFKFKIISALPSEYEHLIRFCSSKLNSTIEVSTKREGLSVKLMKGLEITVVTLYGGGELPVTGISAEFYEQTVKKCLTNPSVR